MPATGPFGFTHLRSDGNRVLDGAGRLPSDPVAFDLGFQPAWLVGLPDGDASVWAAVGPDGRTAGVRLAASDLDGQRVATGPTIGTGFRWRHQLCVAAFGPDGGIELAAVKTPHIGGVVEFYRRSDARLEIAAERAGYSSHAYGSRNLDGALAGDLDGDGAIELLVPTKDRDALTALRRTADSTERAWQLPLGGSLATNVAGITTGRDRAVVVAGTADGTLQFWC